MDIIKDVFFGVVKQLEESSDAVEYVSWITAGIFAVLAVFTIFLAHQFQTNTTESVKITWKIRQCIKDKQSDGLKELFQDFRYFSNIPEVISSSLGISKFIIYFLAAIWGVSGLSKIVGEIKDTNNSTFPFLALLLIAVSTILFIGFSHKLVKTISTITNEDNNELTFKNIEEIKSYKSLDENGYPIENVILLDNLKLKFDILNDEPYLETVIERNYGFSHFAFMLNITHPNFNILLGTNVITIDETLQLEFNDQTKSILNRIFTEENLAICTYQFCFYIGNQAYSFRLNPLLGNNSAPGCLQLNLGVKTNWEPPILQKKQLLRGDKVEVIDKRNP
ncbi:hypothetical protein QNK12_06520 [Neobacillus cucumis]|nr:hypothetical protein QNK12_06520 [Neobacillus cucumis]